MRFRGLVALLSACGASSVQDGYGPLALARRTAARDHGCPVERVKLRCDATRTLHIVDGTVVSHSPGGAAGTIGETISERAYELDVCGVTRLYRQPIVDSESDYVEEPARCPTNAVCVDPEGTCRSVVRGPLWGIAAAAAPTVCGDAPVDDTLGLRVESSRVSIEVVNHRSQPFDRWFDMGCKQPSLFLKIDDRWFPLCGAARVQRDHFESGARRTYATDISLGPGRHSLALFHVQPLEDAWPPCTRSPSATFDVQ